MDVNKRLVELAEGVLVEDDVLRIVERIREYDPNLVIQYCARPDSIADAPYRIMELCPDGHKRLVFSVWQLDNTVMERIYNADNQRHNTLLLLDKANEKARRENRRRYDEEREQAKDIVAHVFASPKNTYSFTDEDEQGKKKVTVSDVYPHKVERK